MCVWIKVVILSSYLFEEVIASYRFTVEVTSICHHLLLLPRIFGLVVICPSAMTLLFLFLPIDIQIYERIDSESIVDADDARLDYFKKKV